MVVAQGGVDQNQAIIMQVARDNGVDPVLALAIAVKESSADGTVSGINPKAVGDGGTSFGIYQLHKGGELGSLSPAQAFDPLTNARVAIAQIAATQKATGLSGGALAAAAQRPANQAAYAADVNGIYAKLKSGGGGVVGTLENLATGAVVGAGGTGLLQGGEAAVSAATSIPSFISLITSASFLHRVLYGGAAVALIVVGLIIMFRKQAVSTAGSLVKAAAL